MLFNLAAGDNGAVTPALFGVVKGLVRQIIHGLGIRRGAALFDIYSDADRHELKNF